MKFFGGGGSSSTARGRQELQAVTPVEPHAENPECTTPERAGTEVLAAGANRDGDGTGGKHQDVGDGSGSGGGGNSLAASGGYGSSPVTSSLSVQARKHKAASGAPNTATSKTSAKKGTAGGGGSIVKKQSLVLSSAASSVLNSIGKNKSNDDVWEDSGGGGQQGRQERRDTTVSIMSRGGELTRVFSRSNSIVQTAMSFTQKLNILNPFMRQVAIQEEVSVVEIISQDEGDFESEQEDASRRDTEEDIAAIAVKEEVRARRRASLQEQQASAVGKSASVAYSIFTVDGTVQSFIIRFNSFFNRRLTLVLIASTLWTACYVPFHVGFSDRIPDDGSWVPSAVANFLVDCLYLWGVACRLVTSVCDLTYGKEWCNRKRIREHAMQDATFWMDVFSLIPLIIQPLPPYVCLMWNDLAKGLEALKLLRLWRLIAIPASHLEAEYSIGVHIGRVVMWVFLLGHVLGCYWFYILESNATTDAHILTASDVGQPSSLFTWYLFALRDGFYILTGRVRPAFSPGEMALVSLTSPTGSFFFAIVSANCTVLLSRLDAVKRKHHEQMCFIRSAMKTLNLPEDLRNRIEKYHLFLAIHHNLNAYSSLFQGLSVQLFTELKATIYDKLFRNAPFFRNAPEEFIHAIVLALEETTFSPGENVIVQGEIGAEMYWILRGRCDVIDSSGVRVVATLCENNFFGEVALLVQTPRLCSVRAATYSLLAQITREKFLPIIDEFPEQKKYFVERIRSYQLDQNTVHKTYSSGSASSDPPVLADAAAAGGAATGELDESGRSNSKEKLQETLVSGDPMKSAGEKPSGSKKKAGLLLSDDSPPETAFRSAFRKTGFARVAAITDDDDEDGNAAGPGREQNNGKTGGPPSLFFPGAGAAATAAPGGVASFFGGMGMGFSSSSGSAANISGGTAGGGTSTATGTSANTTSNAFGVGTLGAITGGMSKPRSSFAHPNREKKLDRRTSFAQGIPAPGEDSLPLGPEVGPEDSISRKGSIVQRNSNQIGQLSRRLTRHSFGEYGATEMPRTYTEIDHELESEVARLHREMEKQTATNFRLAGNPIHEKMHQLKVQQEDSAQRRPSGVPALQKAISKVVLGNRLRQSFAAPASHHAADKESNVGGEKMEAQSVVGVGAQSNRPAGAAGGMSAAERMRRASAVSNHNFISLNSMLNPGSGPPVGRATTHNFGGAASAVSHHVNIGGAAASTNISSGTEQRLLRSLLDPIKEELHIIREMIEDIGVQQDTLEIQIRQLQVPPTSVYGNAPAVPSPSLSNNAGIHHAGSSSPSQSAGMTTNGAPNNPSTAIGSDPAASTAVLQHLGHQHKVSTSTASSSTITASMSMTSSNIMQGGGMGGGGLEGGGASSFTPSAMKGSRAAAGSKSPKSPSAPGSPVSGTASASSHGAGGGGESSFSDSAFPAPANANNAQPGGATTTATGNIPGETSSGSAAQGFGATLANMLGQAGAREPPSSGRASRDEESAVGTNSFDPPSMSTSAVSGIYSNGPPPDIAVTRKATEDREPPGLTLDGRVKGGTSTVGVDAPD